MIKHFGNACAGSSFTIQVLQSYNCFFFYPRTKERSPRLRNNGGCFKSDAMEDFRNIDNIIQNGSRNSFCKIRVILRKLQIASGILRNGSILDIYIITFTTMYLALMTAKSKETQPEKIYKHICIVQFDSKALEATQLPKIVNLPNIIKKLLKNLQEKENIPTLTYKPGNIIRNKILN